MDNSPTSTPTPKPTPTPTRVIIRACVTDIPGDPHARPHRLGRDFCQQILSRPYADDLQAECHDATHILPNLDAPNEGRAWFMYDFNVVGPLSKQEILAIPHSVYHATRRGDSWYVSTWRWITDEQKSLGLTVYVRVHRVFTPRDSWVPEARKYCAMYPWGGEVGSGDREVIA
ncbi:hypothetical protein MBM_06274 [Drepanopeziza brunnea f. sp. 'multigermtubi' MB_m1]|uniref:Uncharacterized protein n=1 Tax=Marssonina brunnea f. sp. multigermtubi (strain MB_m1) TaxID=1072389 RepID=K1WRK7_MARBU|nr:uncharacterized protein MBM_06274 [Drepanopeziza brunnea f. sp. 'multigermtubi' MB_m1]EKD15646.1 hypothetical protein MBM_06274 [Drepanopeziza brunnea f. sp. 'multigermtubi' MB_m1]